MCVPHVLSIYTQYCTGTVDSRFAGHSAKAERYRHGFLPMQLTFADTSTYKWEHWEPVPNSRPGVPMWRRQHFPFQSVTADGLWAFTHRQSRTTGASASKDLAVPDWALPTGRVCQAGKGCPNKSPFPAQRTDETNRTQFRTHARHVVSNTARVGCRGVHTQARRPPTVIAPRLSRQCLSSPVPKRATERSTRRSPSPNNDNNSCCQLERGKNELANCGMGRGWVIVPPSLLHSSLRADWTPIKGLGSFVLRSSPNTSSRGQKTQQFSTPINMGEHEQRQ